MKFKFNKLVSRIEKIKENILNNKILCKILLLLIPIIIGIITFIIIYGVTPLDVTNDKWILSGYDETDIQQHYSGWLAYRNSEWQFPLGMASNMANGVGTIISYTDSIPIVAIVFKIFNNILPKTFQYFGIFALLCYILQSVAAFKILKFKTQNVIYSTIGTILFSFAPILIERSLRHTALGAQWLILFAIYFYLKHREDKNNKIYFEYLLLELLAIGIHPYFLPMVAVFALGSVVYDVKNKKYMSIIYFVMIQIITYLFGVLIGVLGNNISPSRGGFGFYSMNINAIINPTSTGAYTWSRFLKIKPQILGNYDGFNYLGVGILAFIIILTSVIFSLNKKKIVIKMIKNNLYLIIISIGLTLFAISNVVTFNSRVLCTLNIPKAIMDLCGIFRASSRMFYPVYYLIFLFLIICLWRILCKDRKKFAYFVLGSIVIIQLVDIRGCIIEKHLAMDEKANYYSYIEDYKLNEIASEADAVLFDGYENYLDRNFTIFAFKNNLVTYYSVANSGIYTQSETLQNDILSKIRESGDIQNNIIVTTNYGTVKKYTKFDNIDCYEIAGRYILFKKK